MRILAPELLFLDSGTSKIDSSSGGTSHQALYTSSTSFADAIKDIDVTPPHTANAYLKTYIAPALDSNHVESNTQGFRQIPYNGYTVASVGCWLQAGGFWSALAWGSIAAGHGIYLFSQWGTTFEVAKIFGD